MKSTISRFLLAILPVLSIGWDPAGAGAQSLPDPPPVSQDATTQSLLSRERMVWPGVMIILVLALFVTAALCGPLIRANTQENVDDADAERRS